MLGVWVVVIDIAVVTRGRRRRRKNMVKRRRNVGVKFCDCFGGFLALFC